MSNHQYEDHPSFPQHCFDQNHLEYRGRENSSLNSEIRSRPRSYERETCRHSRTSYTLFSIVNEDRRPFIREEDFSIPLYTETNRCCRGLFEIELKVLFSWTPRDLDEAVERETGMRSEDVDVLLKGRMGDMSLRDMLMSGECLMKLFRDGDVDFVLVREKGGKGE